MPIHTPPTLAALLECMHCGEKQGIPEPPDRGSSHFGAWQTAPHQESLERIDKPNLTGLSRCLTDSLLLGRLRKPQRRYYQEHLNEGMACFPNVRACTAN